MLVAWETLRGCWSLKDAAGDARSLLLNRQLRNLFRVVPIYVMSNLISGSLLVFAMRSYVPPVGTSIWYAVFVLVHAGWAIHALRKEKSSRHAADSLALVDLRVSAAWCALAAITCSVGFYLGTPLAADEGSRLLLAAYVPGLIATGVLVGITTPLIAVVWLVVMTAGACLMVANLDFLLQGLTIGMLNWYAVMLLVALLFASRMFVARTAAELEAENERQVVGLLLGDFEENASDWLWECDSAGRVTRASARLASVLGRNQSSVIGMPLISLFSAQRMTTIPSDGEVGVAALQHRLAGTAAFSNVIVEARVNGIQRSWKLSAKPLPPSEGRPTGWRGVGSEVSDARAREAEGINRERHLHHLATHDVLTELPNRRAFLEAVSRMLEHAGHGPTTANAMAFIDLDHFKTVNDTLGHSAGDVVLKSVATRLRRALHPGDFLARLRGHEVALLMMGLPASDPLVEIEARAQRILDHLRTPETIEQFRIDVRGSIGITQALAAPESPYELMRRADIALYVAKDSGRDGFKVYEAAMSSRMEHRLSTVSDLAGAMERGELEVVYQCIVDLETMKIAGCEALLRWHHPRYGELPAAEFTPAADESGLLGPIRPWVLQQARRDALQWPGDITLAVNVSAVQIGSPSIVESILEAVRDTGMPPARVELEITESAISRDDQAARGVLQRLRGHGFQLAIDDFGTGYSSMAQLRELPFDTLKLDRSFVTGLGGERSSASNAIISSLLHLSRSMGMSVIAEGVETRAEWKALQQLGCQYGQGYLFARPQSQRLLLRSVHAGYLDHA